MHALLLLAAAFTAVQPPEGELEKPKPAAKKAQERGKAPPRSRFFIIPASAGVSLPFSWGRSTKPTNLNFDGAALEWGLDCGMDLPNAEVRVSFDSRRYDIGSADGTWNCSNLLVCFGWRHGLAERLDFVLGGGVGAALNSADRALGQPIDEDPASFAFRLYSCLRCRLQSRLDVEIYGRLTFAKADYETWGQSGTVDLSAGSVGVSALVRF